jgi:feruloyl-CoA synthase
MAMGNPVSRVALGDGVFEAGPDGSVRVRNSEQLGPYPSRLTERLEHWAAVAPDRVLLARRAGQGWRIVTYAGALGAARSIGQALLDRPHCGARPVLILSGNGIEHGLLSLACLHVGVPFVPLSTAYSLMSADFTRLRDIVGMVRPGLVFADDGTRYAAAIRACIPADTEVVMVRGDSGRSATQFDELLATVPTSAVDTAASAIRSDTVAKLLFTSGSTGFPKGVISTQGMLCSTQQMLLTCYPWLAEQPPVLVDWLPWNHVLGGTVNFGLALYNGGTLYIDDGKPLPGLIEETVRNLRDVAPVIYSSVPKSYEELVPRLRRDRTLRENFFSRVRILQYAGASIPQHVCDAFDALALDTIGKRIPWVGMLGSTEAGPIAADRHVHATSAGRVGLPMPGVTLKLTPTDGRLEARVRSPSVTPGYWKRDDLTSEALDDEGFFRTGDALDWVDAENPQSGFRYDGRIAEDFKLVTGTWVRVGLLRTRLLKHLAPEIRDVVIAGENRHHVAVLAVPSGPDIADNKAIRARLHDKLTALAQQATGSAQRVLRLAFLTKELSIDAGELTDKGALNQRNVLRRHSALVEELYAEHPADHVICAVFKDVAGPAAPSTPNFRKPRS